MGKDNKRPTPVISGMAWKLQEAQLVLTDGLDSSEVMAWLSKAGRLHCKDGMDMKMCQAVDAQVVLTNRYDLLEVMAWLSEDGKLHVKGKMDTKVCQAVAKELREQGYDVKPFVDEKQ